MNAYCVNCGALLEAGNVYCLNCGTPTAASVEAETVIRKRPAAKGNGTLYAVLGSSGVIAALLGVLIWQTARTAEPPPPNTLSTVTASPVPPSVQQQVAPSPRPTPEQVRRPSPTPIDVDAMRAEIEERERRQRARNIEFDDRGRQMRAICKNGEPSYWQHDKAFTCGMNGGVAQWNPRHPKN